MFWPFDPFHVFRMSFRDMLSALFWARANVLHRIADCEQRDCSHLAAAGWYLPWRTQRETWHENNAPWRRFNWITSQMEIEWNYSNMIYIYIVIIDYKNLNQIIMRFPSVQLFWLKHVETSIFLIQVEGAIAHPCCSMLVNQYLIRWPFIGW